MINMGFHEWYSPNGVSHLVSDHNNHCVTCGRTHDVVDEMAQEIAEGVIAECDGDLDLAIKVIERTKYLLDQRNIPAHDRIRMHIGEDWTFELGYQHNYINDYMNYNIIDRVVGFGDAAGNPPKFGNNDYSEDQL